MRTIERNIVGSFIFSNDAHVLLGKSRKGGVYPGLWICPGGGIEPGETPLEAVIRETLEETGLDISRELATPLDSAASGESEKVLAGGEHVHVRMTFLDFAVLIDKPAADIPVRATDDLAKVAWLPIAHLDPEKIAPGTALRLRQLGHLIA